jgi:hypothetical protein
MPLLQRITTPITALLPDLNSVPQQRQAVGAIAASIGVHLLLVLLFVGGSGIGFFPPSCAPRENRAQFKKPELQPLEVQIVSMPTPESVPELLTPEELQARAERLQIDSTGLAKSEEAPKDPLFESDQDMKAASEKPPTGDAPLPSQDGKALPFTAFKNQDVVLGSAAVPPSPPADLAVNRPSPAAPSLSKPLFQPKPIPPEQTNSTAADETIPKPAEPADAKPNPTPVPVTKPAIDVIQPNDDQIVVAEKVVEKPPGPIARLAPAQVQPRPIPEPVKPKEEEKMDMAKLITPPPRPIPAPQPGFQQQLEKTRIDGSISNRGKAAVDAVKTPLAVYKKQVNAAIGSRWYFYVQQRRDLISLGSAKVSYRITAQGKITDVKIVENTSNQVFGMICEQSIREAEIGPPPEEATPAMIDGRLEGDLTFTYYAGFQ